MARRPADRLQTPNEVVQALQPFAVKDAPSPLPAVVVAPDAAADTEAPPDEPKPERIEDPSFSAMTATGRDMSTGAAAATPVKRAKSLPVKLMLILGGGALAFFFALCLGLCYIGSFFGDPPEKKVTGSIRINNNATKFSMPDKKIRAGDTKRVIVFIERIDYKGPVRITLENLPAGVTAHTVLLPPNSDRDQISFTVSNWTEPSTTPIKVVAESQKKGLRAEMTLELNIVK